MQAVLGTRGQWAVAVLQFAGLLLSGCLYTLLGGECLKVCVLWKHCARLCHHQPACQQGVCAFLPRHDAQGLNGISRGPPNNHALAPEQCPSCRLAILPYHNDIWQQFAGRLCALQSQSSRWRRHPDMAVHHYIWRMALQLILSLLSTVPAQRQQC